MITEHLDQNSSHLSSSSNSNCISNFDARASSHVSKNHIQLISTSSLPPLTRTLFPYQSFNSVQSQVFHIAYKSDSNLVVCAPTGSGKTGIMELAIARLFSNKSSSQNEFSVKKAVYIAPTKVESFLFAANFTFIIYFLILGIML